MFFQDKIWEVLKVDPQIYRIEGVEEIERNRKNFLKMQERKEPVHFSPNYLNFGCFIAITINLLYFLNYHIHLKFLNATKINSLPSRNYQRTS